MICAMPSCTSRPLAGFARRIRSRGEAIRQLIALGQKAPAKKEEAEWQTYGRMYYECSVDYLSVTRSRLVARLRLLA